MYLKIPPVDAVCGTKYGFCPMSDSLSGWHKKYMISGFVPLKDKKSKRGCRGGFSVTGLPAHLEGCNYNRFFHDIAYKYLMNLKSQAFFIAPFAEEELVTNRIRPDLTSLLSGKSLTASTYNPTQHQADKRLTIAINKPNSSPTSLNIAAPVIDGKIGISSLPSLQLRQSISSSYACGTNVARGLDASQRSQNKPTLSPFGVPSAINDDSEDDELILNKECNTEHKKLNCKTTGDNDDKKLSTTTTRTATYGILSGSNPELRDNNSRFAASISTNRILSPELNSLIIKNKI